MPCCALNRLKVLTDLHSSQLTSLVALSLHKLQLFSLDREFELTCVIMLPLIENVFY